MSTNAGRGGGGQHERREQHASPVTLALVVDVDVHAAPGW